MTWFQTKKRENYLREMENEERGRPQNGSQRKGGDLVSLSVLGCFPAEARGPPQGRVCGHPPDYGDAPENFGFRRLHLVSNLDLRYGGNYSSVRQMKRLMNFWNFALMVESLARISHSIARHARASTASRRVCCWSGFLSPMTLPPPTPLQPPCPPLTPPFLPPLTPPSSLHLSFVHSLWSFSLTIFLSLFITPFSILFLLLSPFSFSSLLTYSSYFVPSFFPFPLPPFPTPFYSSLFLYFPSFHPPPYFHLPSPFPSSLSPSPSPFSLFLPFT